MRLSPFPLALAAFAGVALTQSPAAPVSPDAIGGVFVQNRGQWDVSVAMQLRAGPATAWFHDGGVVIDLMKFEAVSGDAVAQAGGLMAVPESRLVGRTALRLSFEGGAQRAPVGTARQPGVVHYLQGADPERWVYGAPTFAALRYDAVWPGVDVVFRECAPWLAYDLHLAPGVAAGTIDLRCEGSEGLSVNADGMLVMRTPYGDVLQTAPQSFELMASGERVPVPSRFVLRGDGRYGFEVDRIEPSRALLIDPGIVWGTYIGGAVGITQLFASTETVGQGVAVTGFTRVPQLPSPWSSNQGSGLRDAVVAVLDTGAGASAPQWTAVIGGSADETAFDVAHDAATNRLTIVGMTESTTSFPCTGNPEQPTFGGGTWDAFIATFDMLSGSCLYSSYLGGAGDDRLAAVSAHASLLTVAGYTDSAPWIPAPACIQTGVAGFFDAIVAQVSPTLPPGSQVLHWTYLGGSGHEGIFAPILLDPYTVNSDMIDLHVEGTSTVTVLAASSSPNYPVTANAFDQTYGGIRDMVITRLDWTSCTLGYSTYLGGDDSDLPNKLHCDPNGVVTVAGSGWLRPLAQFTQGLPTTAGAPQLLHSRGETDMYVARLDPNQTTPTNQLVYATYLGVAIPNVIAAEELYGLAVEPSSGIVVAAGATRSPGLPTTPGAALPTFVDNVMGVALRLEPAGNGMSDVHYLSYLGQTLPAALTVLTDMSRLPDGKVVAVGYSNSMTTSFPMSTSPQPVVRGPMDGAIFLLDLLPASITPLGPSSPACAPPTYLQVNSAPLPGTASFEFLCEQAPPNGWIVLCYGAPFPAGWSPCPQVTAYVNPILAPVALVTDANGFARHNLPIPGWVGTPVWLAAQFGYILPTPCGGSFFGASDALRF